MQAAEQERDQRGLVLDMPADEPNRNSATASLHERNLRYGAGPFLVVMFCHSFVLVVLGLPQHCEAYLLAYGLKISDSLKILKAGHVHPLSQFAGAGLQLACS